MEKTEAIKQAAELLAKAGVTGYITIHDEPFAKAVMVEQAVEPDPAPNESISSLVALEKPLRVWVSRSWENPSNG